MSDLKPIETRYKGYRFRSRLEARWAVFFDGLGVEWEYEKEGYDLGEAGWYLPDFWLEKLKTWVEVKANVDDDEAFKDALRKAAALRDASHGTSAVVVFGAPWDASRSWAYFQDMSESSGGFIDEWGGAFCLCPVCGAWFDYYKGRPSSHGAVDKDWQSLPECRCIPMLRDRWGERPLDAVAYADWCEVCRLRTGTAARAACSARFEHGEIG